VRIFEIFGHDGEYDELELAMGPDVGGVQMESKFEGSDPMADLCRIDDKCSIPELLGCDWMTYRQLVDSKRKAGAIVSGWYFSHPASDPDSARGQATHNSQTSVVEVCVFWSASPPSPEMSARQPSSGRGRIIVQRVMASTPQEMLAGSLPKSPTGGSRESELVTERLQDATDDYVAKRLMDPAWEKFAKGWATPVCENMASAAETISGLRDQLHQLVLGNPIKKLTGLKPLASIGAEIALPGDELFRTTKLLIEGAGIVVGLLAHQPLLVNACLKSFTHDAALHAVSKGVGGLLADTCSPLGTPQEISSPKRPSEATNYKGFNVVTKPAGSTESIRPPCGHMHQPVMNLSDMPRVVLREAGTTDSVELDIATNGVPSRIRTRSPSEEAKLFQSTVGERVNWEEDEQTGGPRMVIP